MKSYSKHLQSTETPQKGTALSKRPVFRSSAIFPVLQSKNYFTRICFLGYWLLKREIREISLLYTLRDSGGGVIKRELMMIENGKSFSIELGSLLSDAGIRTETEDEFYGSLEFEIFSTRDLVFPYPAFVLCYYNGEFSTAVHTTGRIYNDAEDWKENEDVIPPESGFDIYGNKNLNPFLAFTNGAFEEKSARMDYVLINHTGKTLQGSIELGELTPYQTVFLYFKEHIKNLESLLEEKPGTIKITHGLKGFFPRFIAGNFQETPRAASITHTYYDLSRLSRDADYWKLKDDRFHSGSIFAPIFIENNFYTELIFYPIYSPSRISLSLSYYDETGNLLRHLPHFATLDTAGNTFERIDLKTFALKHKVDPARAKGVFLTQEPIENHEYPIRVKMGLNVGRSNRPMLIPSNICFNAQVGNPKMEEKARSFRWAPFLNIGNSVVILTNSSPLKNYVRTAKTHLQFFREADDERIERSVEIPAFGQVRIELEKDEELKLFFGGKTGWITALTDHAYLNGWYFDFHENGAVAADHGF